jgi:hypothetical protein
MKGNAGSAEAWGRLCEFLDAEDEGVQAERLQAAAEFGTDIERLAARLRMTARKAVQDRIRAESMSQRHASRSMADILAEIESWTAEKLRAWLEDVRAGSLGDEARILVEPCFRNKSEKGSTDEELRTQVADVLKALARGTR